MKQFNKTQIKEIEAFRDKLQDQRRVIEEALNKAQTIVNEAVADANTLRENAVEYLQDLQGKAEDYLNERSDAWQESDAGSEYQGWIDAIGNVISELEEEIDICLSDAVSEQLDEIEDASSKLEEDYLPRAPGS